MELSPTAYVILGMLRHEPRSGYEIKQAVDRSTRFFWAASYGQIYPELRRLRSAGLVDGESQRRGGRRRTIYRLTDAGRDVLRGWLGEPPEVFEMRDEGLLKLFFASAGPPGSPRQTIDEMRRRAEEKHARLREIEPAAAAHADADPYPYMALRYGLEFSDWVIEACERMRAELDGAERPGDEAASKRSRRRNDAG